tara:strand:+ start:1932 stop:2675 length:744 start_codon:yes stop_codon:yes gene_type:complete
MFRVLISPGNVKFDGNIPAGIGAFSVVIPIGSGVVSGSGAADDVLTQLQTALVAAGIPASVTLNATTWRVGIDVGAGNTLQVMGADAATTCDLHLLGFDQGVNTAAVQVTTAPQAPLGTWASPVPLGGGNLRRRTTQGAQVVSVSGRVVSVKRAAHLTTNFEFTDVAEASVFHSGLALSPTAHDADAFERFWENVNDGAQWQYSLDKTVRTSSGVWVMNMSSNFAPTRRLDGWPFFTFAFSAREYVA